MKVRTLCTALSLSLTLGLAPATARNLQLEGVTFPEQREVDLEFQRQPGAPAARMRAEVTYRDGQARVWLSYWDMKPAILFGGDITCYVLWAVTVGGIAENMGEVIVSESKGAYEFSTGKKDFALMITAEPFYLVSQPSETVIFLNLPPPSRKAPSKTFGYSGFGPVPRRAMESIENIRWDSGTPLDLLQARKAYELAGTHDAATHAPRVYQEAGDALERANQRAERSPKDRRLLEDARRSVAMSNESINIALHRKESLEIEQSIARRRAEMEGLEQRAAQAEATAAEAERLAGTARGEVEGLRQEHERMVAEGRALAEEKTALEGSLTGLRQEAAALKVATERLQGEKAALNIRLEDALSHVAETTESVRGFVVNLPDILFDVNSAQLKREAEVVLAKLAGILLIIPDLKITVEGHTDSTGDAQYNESLSQKRAEGVMAYLVGEGIDGSRQSALGLGMRQPIADNSSAEGRRSNRRVELIISGSES